MKKLLYLMSAFVFLSACAFSQIVSDQGVTNVNIARDVAVLKTAQPADIWITVNQTWKALNYWEFQVTGEPTAQFGYQLSISESPGGPAYLSFRNRTIATKLLSTDTYAPGTWSSTGVGMSTGTVTLSGSSAGSSNPAGTFYFRIGCETKVQTGYNGGTSGLSTSVTGLCNITTYSI